jgi:ribosomal-protein-alanine N-acetyltransferase
MEMKLVPVDVKLLDSYYNFYLDEETRRYDPFPAPTLDALRERISKASSQLSDFRSARAYFWFIKKGTETVAHVSLHNLNPMMMTAELGFGVHPSARGKGLATKAIRLVTQKVFSESPVRKLIAFVDEENSGSRKALEKVGYQQEGFFRESYVLKGLPRNEAVYGILPGDLS